MFIDIFTGWIPNDSWIKRVWDQHWRREGWEPKIPTTCKVREVLLKEAWRWFWRHKVFGTKVRPWIFPAVLLFTISSAIYPDIVAIILVAITILPPLFLVGMIALVLVILIIFSGEWILERLPFIVKLKDAVYQATIDSFTSFNNWLWNKGIKGIPLAYYVYIPLLSALELVSILAFRALDEGWFSPLLGLLAGIVAIILVSVQFLSAVLFVMIAIAVIFVFLKKRGKPTLSKVKKFEHEVREGIDTRMAGQETTTNIALAGLIADFYTKVCRPVKWV